MSKLIVEKVNKTAKLPVRAYQGDVGLDLFANESLSVGPQEQVTVKTGIRLQIPAGHVGLVWDRGSTTKKGFHCIAGVIDAGYRGELIVQLLNITKSANSILQGQKIAQLIIQKFADLEVEEGIIEDETERGDGKFGSSGQF